MILPHPVNMNCLCPIVGIEQHERFIINFQFFE